MRCAVSAVLLLLVAAAAVLPRSADALGVLVEGRGRKEREAAATRPIGNGAGLGDIANLAATPPRLLLRAATRGDVWRAAASYPHTRTRRPQLSAESPHRDPPADAVRLEWCLACLLLLCVAPSPPRPTPAGEPQATSAVSWRGRVAAAARTAAARHLHPRPPPPQPRSIHIQRHHSLPFHTLSRPPAGCALDSDCTSTDECRTAKCTDLNICTFP